MLHHLFCFPDIFFLLSLRGLPPSWHARIQIPLQPLADNLESQTYEVFEKDPVKYVNYERAVYLALLDLKKQPGRGSETFCVMVVGAGRGPLVRATLNASKSSGVPVFVYALDKNPNAVVTLRYFYAPSVVLSWLLGIAVWSPLYTHMRERT
jgi:hypothetical protein